MTNRDGHVRVLPLHVANKIAAGEVVERPASVVKELVENALDAGADRISVSVVQGGRKLVAVQDNGCGMTRDDAVLSLERQATSKIRDVNDIEEIDTLGFRGEAIPSIASVSRFSLTTRRRDSDEGTKLVVNAGTLAEVGAAGCPPGTLVEVRDLFCNVPARRKFLRSYATEESHVRQVVTIHALAHPAVGFTFASDGRELYRLAPAANVRDRVRDLFGEDFLEQLVPVPSEPDDPSPVRVTGFIERPNPAAPTRRDQYVFVNGRPATAPSIAGAIREAYPRHQGDVKPAAVLFLELPPSQVDVNVHPTKREVRFRDNGAVRRAVMAAIDAALFRRPAAASGVSPERLAPSPSGPFPGRSSAACPAPSSGSVAPSPVMPSPVMPSPVAPSPSGLCAASPSPSASPASVAAVPVPALSSPTRAPDAVPSTEDLPAPAPVQAELPVVFDGERAAPWQWFRFLAVTSSGYLLVETDAGIVTVNPAAARERIAYERLLAADGAKPLVQTLLIPEIVRLTPAEFARLGASLEVIRAMGFELEEFGNDVFKVEAVPQLVGNVSATAILATVARDLADGAGRRVGTRWREELVAKSVARTYAGAQPKLNADLATKLVEELAACRMPYVCPRGKAILYFISTRELNRKFSRD